jgi:uncharacterized protein YutE (UPF0331/DUF86 family)
MGAIAADLSSLLALEVDISDLATTDAIFRFEVARSARILFEGTPGAFAGFLAKTLIDYADIQRFVPELIEGVARAARRGRCSRARSLGVSGEVLARKGAAIRSRTMRVRGLFPQTVEEFVSRRTEAEALILNLYLALQECSDLALHLVADLGLGVPGEPRAAFEALARAGVLEPALARKLGGAIGLRNRIAHEYGTLDLAKVFEAVCRDLGDLDDFAAAAASVRLPSL